MNKLSIGLNVGGADGHAPIRMGRPKLYQPNFVQGNVHYMFNNRFGVVQVVQILMEMIFLITSMSAQILMVLGKKRDVLKLLQK